MTRADGDPLMVGLTGSIGAGKSSVARLLERHGALVIDADVLAREATEDAEVLRQIAAQLGPELVRDGRFDRQAAARKVFEEPAARAVLNGIVHPWVGARREELQRRALEARPAPPVIVNDVPLLFEAGLDGSVDATVVVTAPLELRVRRVGARSGLSADEVRARDAAQLPQEEKAARADFVVSNAGSEADLEAEVARLWAELLARRATLG